MTRRVRLKDIADQTGFSTNTVSLALHRDPRVAEETSKAILAVARRLNYRPNQLARSLVSQRSHTVGLILTNIENPILTRVAKEIHAKLAEHRYATLFAATNHSLDLEMHAIDLFLGHQVDGILIYPSRHDRLGHIEDAARQGTPTVLLAGDTGPGVDAVMLDDRVGARLAAEHLIALGHRRIALLDNAGTMGSLEKSQGYDLALQAAGIVPTPDLKLDPGGFGARYGYRSMQQIAAMDDMPTAVMANDLLALGILHWCRDHGVHVPDDMSIVGFDNLEMTSHVSPPLTTVNYAAEYLSQRAVELLLHRIGTPEHDIDDVRSELIRPDLVLRQSTAAPARRVTASR